MASKKEIAPERAAATFKDMAAQNPTIKTNVDPATESVLESFRKTAEEELAVERSQGVAQVKSGGFVGSPMTLVPANKKFKLIDGRVLEMGPPQYPFPVVIPKIFRDRDEMSMVLHSDMQCARVMQYVRSIDGVPVPQPLASWPEVANLAHQLGDIGCKVAYDVYGTNWPDDANVLAVEIKN